MKIFYNIRSPAAILGGVAASGGATALLVRDATITGLTVDIALMPILVALTILAGHLFWQALRGGRVISAAGLVLLAIFGSGLIVYETMGRRAEIRDVKVATASDVEERRQHLKKMLVEAQAALGTHRTAMDAECASGKGKKCDGLTYTVSTWDSAVTGYEAKLAKLPPPTPVDPKAERIAATLALMGLQFKAGEVQKAVATLEPFAMPLFLEFGSIILFGFGLAHRRRPAIPAPAPAEQVTPAAEPIPTPPSPKGGSVAQIEAERDLVTLMALGTPIPSQDWLAERWGVQKGTVSKWMSKWERAGIVTRASVGRCKQIEAA